MNLPSITLHPRAPGVPPSNWFHLPRIRYEASALRTDSRVLKIFSGHGFSLGPHEPSMAPLRAQPKLAVKPAATCVLIALPPLNYCRNLLHLAGFVDGTSRWPVKSWTEKHEGWGTSKINYVHRAILVFFQLFPVFPGLAIVSYLPNLADKTAPPPPTSPMNCDQT